MDAATRCSDDNSNGVQFLMALLLVYNTNSFIFWVLFFFGAMMLSGVLCRKQLVQRFLLRIMHTVLFASVPSVSLTSLAQTMAHIRSLCSL